MTCRNNVFRNLRKLLCFASLLWLLSFILSLTSVYFCLIIITNISHSQPVEHCNVYLWPLNKTNKLLEINEELIYQAVLLRIINNQFQVCQSNPRNDDNLFPTFCFLLPSLPLTFHPRFRLLSSHCY